MRKEVFVEGEYYHVYNRGVDRRKIFLDDNDRQRFLHTLYVLNNFSNIPPRFNFHTLEPNDLLEAREKPFVKIVAGCFMPNHFHLVVSPLGEKGSVSKFFHKVGVSYSMYFNKKRERTGRLFESTFKAKWVDRQGYADYITHYIHLNPRDLFQTKSSTEVENYQWSSLPEYVGKKGSFSLILDSSFRDEVLGISAEEYRKLFLNYFHSLP